MKILQPSRARSNESLLARIWACTNGVDITDADDMHVPGDDFQRGDVFMKQEHWDTFNAWKYARRLMSADAIQRYLKQYGFVPWNDLPVDEGGYRQVLIAGGLYLMDTDAREASATPLQASYQEGVWHLEETEERGHYILDEAGRLSALANTSFTLVRSELDLVYQTPG